MLGPKRIVLIGVSVVVTAVIGVLALYAYNRPWNRGIILSPLHELQTAEKVVALTFDDGPSPELTPALLELLERLGVRATFFMVGRNIEAHPDIAHAVAAAGHLIGNHSYDHSRLVFRSPSFIADQIDRTDELIRMVGQADVTHFRPPYCSKLILLPLALKARNKTLVTGSYDPPSEYRRPFNGDDVANEVIRNAKPGAIIFLHDGIELDRTEFLFAVEQIVTSLRNDGYRFVTVDYESERP